jgi:hypothetical protein
LHDEQRAFRALECACGMAVAGCSRHSLQPSRRSTMPDTRQSNTAPANPQKSHDHGQQQQNQQKQPQHQGGQRQP